MPTLEKHFDAAFTAPNGIKKLRELILTLAMQGKLVPQDPTDQPASALLKDIEAGKKRLIKEGKIKPPKPLPPIKPDETPYTLPKGWEWVRLGNIGIVNPRNAFSDEGDAGFVPMPMIFSDINIQHKFETRKWAEIKTGYTHFADSDIGLAKITPCFENAKSCVFSGLPNGVGAGTTELHVFRNAFHAIEGKYLLAYLKNPRYIAVGASKMTGSAGQKRVPTDFFAQHPFPLPPLAEQRRIVAKIDQLMARCDELEKLKAEQAQKRSAVHTAALNRLLTAPNTNDFTAAWQFLTQNFSELYSVKENVAELRKAILQLAVMGKLVPQDPTDQPASALLKDIEAEKKRLVKDGKIKAPKPLPPIKPDETPYTLPKGWEWVRLGNMTTIQTGKKDVNQGHDDGLYPFFSCAAEPLKSNEYSFDCEALLLPGNGANVGLVTYYFGKFEAYQRTYVLSGFFCCSPQYIERVLRARFLKSLDGKQYGSAINYIKLGSLTDFLVPLPPLAEQRRIVAKIDQLMARCDELEKQIDGAASTQTDLLNAVMAQV